MENRNLSGEASLPTDRPHEGSGLTSSAVWTQGLRLEALANLAHELRTPIQVLLGYIEILRDEWTGRIPAEPGEIIERMAANVYDLAQTIDNVVEFALGEASSATRLVEEFLLTSLLSEVTPVLQAANQRKQLDLRFDLDRAPDVVRAPRRTIRSILLNLALNAIKFTESGSVTVKIVRTLNPTNETLQIEVSDTGPGFSPAMLHEASKPFSQLSTSSSRRHRGVGLGLALVQRNISALNGVLELYNPASGGSRFVVKIPGHRRELLANRAHAKPGIDANSSNLASPRRKPGEAFQH